MDSISRETKSPTLFERFFGVIFVVTGIVGALLGIGSVYVACHFLGKIW